MAGILLSPEDREKLTHLMAEIADPSVRRRAEIVLLYDDGLPTRVVAHDVQLSPQQTRHWRLEFERQGFDIFGETRTEPQVQTETQIWRKGGRPASVSKAERGYTCVDLPTALDPSDHIAEAARKILRAQFGLMLKHEGRVRQGGDVEAVHDLRVTTRRMRAAFDLFTDAFQKKAVRSHAKDLRSVGRALGRVRDLEVMIENLEKYQGTLPEDQREGLAPLVDFWHAAWERKREDLLAFLERNAFLEFKSDFDDFLAEEGAGAHKFQANTPMRICELAPIWLYGRLAEVRAFEPNLQTLPLEELHSLRMHFKHLRYAIEFFREILGGQAKGLISDMKAVQDHLGKLNDAYVAALEVRSFLDDWQADQNELPVAERANPAPILTYLSHLHAVVHDLSVSFPQTWEHFNRPELRRNFAAAISEL
jgi:CHAD domain-containing protein